MLDTFCLLVLTHMSNAKGGYVSLLQAVMAIFAVGLQLRSLFSLWMCDILNPAFLRLTSRKLLWLDLQPADIKSRWTHNWKSAQVVNSHLRNPTIWQPGFDLPRQQWSLLNRFRTEQGHCGACRRE